MSQIASTPAEEFAGENSGDALILRDVELGGTLRLGQIIFHGQNAVGLASQFCHEIMKNSRRIYARVPEATRHSGVLAPGTPARLLSVEIQDHLKYRETCRQKATSIASAARTLDLLVFTCGDIDASQVVPQHIFTLWDLLRWAPPGLTSDPALKALGVDGAIALGQELKVPGPAPDTLNKHQRHLAAFFNQLCRVGAIRVSPMAAFRPIKLPPVRKAGEGIRYYSEEQLKAIFAPSTFVSWALKYPHRWWLPILALYTGARVNELAQLKVSDIAQLDGDWFILIQQTEDEDLSAQRIKSRQSVKSRSSERCIPIHPALVSAGFLEFVKDMERVKSRRLFPHLSAGTDAKTGETKARYSHSAIEQFSAYLKKLEFPRHLGFHAFRHMFVTKLKQMKTPDAELALLTGHSQLQVASRAFYHYVHGDAEMDATQAKVLVARLHYPVDLPKYQLGQFDKTLVGNHRLHP